MAMLTFFMSIPPVWRAHIEPDAQHVLPGLRGEHALRPVGLKPESHRAVPHLQQLHLAAPAMDARPADLALGGKALSKVFGDCAGFAEGLRNTLWIRVWVLGPFGDAGGGIDAH